MLGCWNSLISAATTFGVLGQVWYLIVSIPDLCTLIYFYTKLFLYSVLIILFCIVVNLKIMVNRHANWTEFGPLRI